MIGLGFYYLFSLINWKYVGAGIALALAGLGFAIGTFKVPESNAFQVTRKASGADIDEVFLRYIKFKQKKKRIYLYAKEGKK